jgi:hypothetical protein
LMRDGLCGEPSVDEHSDVGGAAAGMQAGAQMWAVDTRGWSGATGMQLSVSFQVWRAQPMEQRGVGKERHSERINICVRIPCGELG